MEKPRVAVVCAYFKNSLISELMETLGPDAEMHLWALDEPDPTAAQWTRGQGRAPKFQIFNRLAPHYADADYVFFTDDDVGFSPGFLPAFIEIVRRFSFDVAQPALSLQSFHVDRMALQRPGLLAREVNWFGHMIFMMSARFLRAAGPFPEDIDWGAGVVWADVAAKNGFHIGVVDALPARHETRPQFTNYSWKAVYSRGSAGLRRRGLAWPETKTIAAYGPAGDPAALVSAEAVELVALAMRSRLWDPIAAILDASKLGFDPREPTALFVQLAARLAASTPHESALVSHLPEELAWLRPVLKCAIAITQLTPEGAPLAERVCDLRGDELVRFLLDVHTAPLFAPMTPQIYAMSVRRWNAEAG